LELDRSAQNHDTFYHAHITREQASGLLNEDRSQLATFSFSGSNANKIMINEMYKNSSNTYRYSLDGGNSFTQTQDSEILLNEKEIKKVCTVCGIIVGIMGSSQNFKVVINKQILAQDDYFANNDEGKLSGNKEHLV
jgi:possible family 98 glycosyl hydrolase (alpha-N-acetylglucosaminidase)